LEKKAHLHDCTCCARGFAGRHALARKQKTAQQNHQNRTNLLPPSPRGFAGGHALAQKHKKKNSTTPLAQQIEYISGSFAKNDLQLKETQTIAQRN